MGSFRAIKMFRTPEAFIAMVNEMEHCTTVGDFGTKMLARPERAQVITKFLEENTVELGQRELAFTDWKPYHIIVDEEFVQVFMDALRVVCVGRCKQNIKVKYLTTVHIAEDEEQQEEEEEEDTLASRVHDLVDLVEYHAD